MTPSGQSDSQRSIALRLSPAADARLREIAADAGMKTATVAAGLLEELLPTVQGVRHRLQVVRKPGRVRLDEDPHG